MTKPSRTLLLIATLAWTCALLCTAHAQDEDGGFEEYRIVVDRNIFDRNRHRQRSPEESTRPESTQPDRRHVDLTGVVIGRDKAVAFLEGPEPGDAAQLTSGGMIAGHRVAEISAGHVAFVKDGEKVDVPVGARLVEADEGRWQVQDRPGRLDEPQSSDKEDDETEASASDDTPEVSEEGLSVLERMRQRRREDME